MGLVRGLACVLVIGLVFGLGSNLPVAATGTDTVRKAESRPVKRVTQRPGNLNGGVFVLEYHHVDEEETRWGRSAKNFRRDLERLYKLGFRPVTLNEYATNTMKLPSGASPVAITFDDGWESQYRILPNGRIDPNSAVGVWRKFAETRPDFPVKGTFFVLPPVPFARKATAQTKIDNLKRWGSEIGIHTLSHARLDKMTDDRVKGEIGGSIEWLRKYGVNARTLAMPYGVQPKNRALLKEFIWKGQRYRLNGAVRVGAKPAPAPTSKGFDRANIPRIQGADMDYALSWWLRRVEKNKVDLYVQP